MGSTDEAREHWDREAARFDEGTDHGLDDPAVRQAWSDLLVRLLPEAPARVVDMGCGTGSLSLVLAERGFVVTGVDVSPAMLAIARGKAAAAGAAVDLRLGDAADPALPPGSFDVVLCRHVLWALPDPAAAVRRWRRLLEPGGAIVLIEGRWSTGGGLTAAALRALVHEQGLDATVRRLDDERLWGGRIADERYALVART